MIPIHLIAVSICFGQEDETVYELSPFSVSTDADVEYTSQNSISATRTNVGIKNLPQSIVVFNQDLLDDLNLVSLTAILDMDASFMNGFSSEDGVSGEIRARGMGVSSGSVLLVDGFESLATNSIIPIVGVERIEILKGPNAVLYGATSPAGVINRISKRPSFDRAFGSITASIGDPNTNSKYSTDFSIDYSTPLDLKLFPKGWGEFAFRTEIQDATRALVKNGATAKAFTAYNALSWRKGNTSLDLDLTYGRTASDVPWAIGIMVDNGGLGADGFATGTRRYGFNKPDGSFHTINKAHGLRYTPSGTRTGDDDARKTKNTAYRADFQHRFNETVSFRSQIKREKLLIDRMENLMLSGSDEWPVNRHPDTGNLVIGYTNPDTEEFMLGKRPGRVYGLEKFDTAIGAEDWLVPRRPRYRDEDRQRTDMRHEFLIEAETGGLKHNLLIGYQTQRDRGSRTRVEVRNPGSFPNPEDVANYPEDGKWEFVSTIDPVGGGPLNFPANSNHNSQTGGSFVPRADYTQIRPNNIGKDTSSFYVNDLISAMDDRLYMNLGYRVQKDKDVRSSNVREADGDPITLGALYHLNDSRTASIYANTNETFQPVYTVSDDGYDLPPITGGQFEVGVKLDLGAQAGKRPGLFTGNLTYFELEMINLPVNISEDETQSIYRPSGVGRTSEGMEISFSSNPTKGFRIFGSMAYLLDSDNPALVRRGKDAATVNSITGGKLWPENVSRFVVNTLARYQVLEGGMKGSFVSLGLRYNSMRNSEVDFGGGITRALNYLYHVPAETKLNFGIGREFERERSTWRVSLFVDNLTDVLSTGRSINFKSSFDPGRTIRLQFRNNF
jgi:outer membrane receptor protein involved in Fe transport